jgi:hypothetical protein
MVTGFGRIQDRFIEEIIVWIKSRGLGFTNGLENRFIRENFGMTIDRVLENIMD